MGGLQASESGKQQTPEDLAAIWKLIQAENERKRAMSMNEMSGAMTSQQQPDMVSQLLKSIGGF